MSDPEIFNAESPALLRFPIRVLCACIAVFFLSGVLLVFVFERNWKLLISGSVCCCVFGYLATTGRTPRFLR